MKSLKPPATMPDSGSDLKILTMQVSFGDRSWNEKNNPREAPSGSIGLIIGTNPVSGRFDPATFYTFNFVRVSDFISLGHE